MSRQIVVPTISVHAGLGALNKLLAALQPMWHFSGLIVLDFNSCTFLSAPAAAMLSSAKLWRDAHNWHTETDTTAVAPALAEHFGRWRLSNIVRCPDLEISGTAVPLFHQPALDQVAAVQYITDRLTAAEGMPRMSDSLAGRTRNSFVELILNAFHHASSPMGVIALGQFYPRKKRFDVCVCDAGDGLVNHVQAAGFGREHPCDAIKWALEKGHSTKIKPYPSGIGLYLLREFVKVNGGRFRIYANSGCYSEEGGNASYDLLRPSFNGTLVELRLIVRPDETYTLGAGDPALLGEQRHENHTRATI